jgi:ribonuclease HI
MENLDDRDINIFTDGSSYSRPRRGGIGIRFITTDTEGAEHTEDYPLPGYEGATNQQMEIQACIEALRAVVTRRAPVQRRQYRRLVIWTDSMYLVEGYTRALFNWQVNGWFTSSGNPVANAAMWKELLKLAGRSRVPPVEFRWIKGHKKSAHNKAADKLAKKSASRQPGRRASIVKVRRKRTEKSVARGSIAMNGQRATIRIITDEYQRTQRMNRYKYEMISKGSPHRGCVDEVFSQEDIYLSAGHTYYIKFNTDTHAPRVVKVFREVP